MAASTNDIIDISVPSQLHNVNMSNVTKLTSSNFLMWDRQVRALLAGYGLASYLDATVAPPDPTIQVNDVSKENPKYVLWQRQDQLLYSSLLGAISVDVQPILSKANTSAQIWQTLSSTYAKPSWGHIKQIREQIKQWKKGTRTVDAYVQGFTTRFDQLALLGKPYEHEEQVDYILGGLPEDYKPVIDQIDGCDTPPSLSELHEKTH
ncbi:PREDICTED: uncharacterized protein LOC104714982 [Camelina sativa]|uniref:Uncharacterized protein LOC104714980 n=1 Tax=Camelina sativa TaxID=90675 RepID=A0ABM0TST5_CAMSA|nr:PREDICTED: uncharacterized protein LOC104714980 [Camelina sativa]XP_010430742.1 PREDICTED: uncharacterized protein LOC104714982 [Camelina sativa]